MQTKKKTQLLTAIIAVLISVSLVALAVYATTTVGNDVSVGGTLTVTGTSTLASTLYVNQATGRVGIGTTSPSVALDVVGAITATGTGSFNKLVLTNTAASYDDIRSANDDFTIQLTNTTGESMPNIVAAAGARLDLYLYSDGDTGGWANYMEFLVPVAGTGYDHYIQTTGPLDFQVSGAPDNSPDSDDYIKFQTVSNVPEITTVGSADLKINAGGSNDLLLNDDGGYVGIGTTSPSVALDVVGAITATGTGTFNKLSLTDTSSDYDQFTTALAEFTFKSTYTGGPSSWYFWAPSGQDAWVTTWADGANWSPRLSLGVLLSRNQTVISSNLPIDLSHEETGDFYHWVRIQNPNTAGPHTGSGPEITTGDWAGQGTSNLKITSTGGTIDFDDGNLITLGNVGIGTTTPSGDLHVLDTTASSTVYVGDAAHSGCIVMGDSNNVGLTYVTVLDGVLTATSTKPAICK